jgi:hypothetical protein
MATNGRTVSANAIVTRKGGMIAFEERDGFIRSRQPR